MQFGGSAAWFLLAGAIISSLGGLCLSVVDLHFYNHNRTLRFGYKSKWVGILDACLACGFFGLLRAVVSIGSIVLLALSRLLKPMIVFVVLVISAGLYFLEIVTGGVVIQRAGRFSIDFPDKQDYWQDRDYAHWVTHFNERQSQYKKADNPEWGQTSSKEQGLWLDLLLPEQKGPNTGLYQYKVPDTYTWEYQGFEGWAWDLFRPEYSEGTVYHCIIKYNESRDIVEHDGLYDCDRLNLVVEDCLSGWGEADLNIEAKKACQRVNEEQFENWERNKLVSWKGLEKVLAEGKKERAKQGFETVGGVYVLNSLLIALQTGACAMTVAGLVLSMVTCNCKPRLPRDISTATETADETVSETAEETAPFTVADVTAPDGLQQTKDQEPGGEEAEKDSSHSSVFQSSESNEGD